MWMTGHSELPGFGALTFVSGVLKSKEHNSLETGALSILKCLGETPVILVP
jgi:hypothetical protein